MIDLPVMLNVRGRRCVIVGGGRVALRRLGSLLAAGAQVEVIAPEVEAAIEALAEVKVHRRAWCPGDLDGAKLVVIATSDAVVNAAAAKEAAQAGALVNRADDPAVGDVSIPAHASDGLVTIAVHTGGASAAAAAAIRRELSASLAPHWPAMLALAQTWRPRVQQAVADTGTRQARLAAMTDQAAVDLYNTQGGVALEAYYEKLADATATLDQLHEAAAAARQAAEALPDAGQVLHGHATRRSSSSTDSSSSDASSSSPDSSSSSSCDEMDDDDALPRAGRGA